MLSKPLPSSRSLLGRGAPRLGLLIDWLTDPYQEAIVRGARAAAEERGASLVTLAGGVLGAPGENGARRNHLFELAGMAGWDGAILLSGTLGNFAGAAALDRLRSSLGAIPVCSIAVELDDCVSVSVDNAAGMSEAVAHLVHRHDCRRIAFIRGPEVNREAEARYQGYLKVLEAGGLPIDERLIAPGDFQLESGRAAVKLLLDERGLSLDDIDAIVGATDLQMLGALGELRERGYRVPDDVLLVGFDDVDQARFSDPPLSTVRQPLFEQGYAAVRLVLGQLGQESTDERTEVQTRFLARRSCGCLIDAETTNSSSPPDSRRLSIEANLVARRDVLRAELTRASRGTFSAAGAGWEDRLLSAIGRELSGELRASADAYFGVINSVAAAGGDLGGCQELISALRRQLLRVVQHHPGDQRRVEGILHRFRIITAEVLERRQARRRLEVEAWAKDLSLVTAELVTSFDLGDFQRAVHEHLPRLGIEACYVARYVDASRAELIAGYPLTPGERPGQVYPAANLVPPRAGGAFERKSEQLVVVPLLFHEQPFGFVVFGLSDGAGYVYEVLRDVIAAALRGAGFRVPDSGVREHGEIPPGAGEIVSS